MALIDEGKLQGNVINILDILRKDQQCCSYIDAQFMCMDGTTTVWVLTSEKGKSVVYDAPNGTIIASPGVLAPVTSCGV